MVVALPGVWDATDCPHCGVRSLEVHKPDCHLALQMRQRKSEIREGVETALLRDIAGTLEERGGRYGDYPEQSRVTANIKAAMRGSKNWEGLHAAHAEALEMIAVKIARILSGDPKYEDNWHDIEGYAHLAKDACGINPENRPDLYRCVDCGARFDERHKDHCRLCDFGRKRFEGRVDG